MKILVLALTLLCLGIRVEAQKKRGSLYGLVAVVDPGHGGTDPGSFRVFKGERVTESEYVYDVSLRVARLIRERAGLALITIKGGGERDLPADKILVGDHQERFATDNTVVKAGTVGLQKRLDFGNATKHRYPKHSIVWLSIHFDVVGDLSSVEGVRIIAADTSSRLAQALERSFRSAKRLRDQAPLVSSGDRVHGIRHLYVLGPKNEIKEKVLIELGNFLNDADLWRIRDPEVRERYARTIVDALEKR